jgi:uncharacterized 2Fe-2S/4Fe-4S cluster protein (DUF4445 family)
VTIKTTDGKKEEVLACQTPVCDGMRIYVPSEEQMHMAEDAQNLEADTRFPADRTENLVASCDIGTTTVVCHLSDGKNGRRLASVGEANAQRMYGADVISRISAASDGNLEQMQQAIVGQINTMIETLCLRAGTDRSIDHISVAGNTVMCHILCGLSPETIGVSPFAPLSFFGAEEPAEKYGLKQGKTLYIAPAVAGYVGGDITADLLAAGMYTGGVRDEKMTLLLDIGTNGEMVLGSAGSYVCCATAAGPAFEGAEITMGMPACTGAVSKVWLEEDEIRFSVIGGGKPTGICGSGLIDALAVALTVGLVDETGCIADEEEVDEKWAHYLTEDENGACIQIAGEVRLTQSDIRKLQLAKAAIAAGIEILLKEQQISCEQVDELLLAGGFGSFLRIESAAAIGLIPKQLLSSAQAVGNAAGEGAVLAGLSKEAQSKLGKISQSMHYVELSTHSAFSESYMDQMYFM